MNRICALTALLALLPVARAHESLVPHTHAIGGEQSDLSVLCIVGVVALSAGLLFFRWFDNRRRLNSSAARRRRS